jgi:hypothetical protein
MNEKLVELLKNEAIAKELLEKETAEDAQKFLADKGVDISIDEIENIRKGIISSAEEDEEIDDEQLEKVAGGFSISTAITVASTIYNIGNIVTRRRW